MAGCVGFLAWDISALTKGPLTVADDARAGRYRIPVLTGPDAGMRELTLHAALLRRAHSSDEVVLRTAA